MTTRDIGSLDWMKMRNSELVRLLCIVLSLSALMVDASDVDMITKDVHDAIHDPQKYVRWKQLFAGLSDTQLTLLCQDMDDSVSVVAAWEMYVRTPMLAGGDSRNAIGKHRTKSFLSFCEGRLKIQFPEWYRNLLETGRISKNAVTFAEDNERPKRLSPRVWTYDSDVVSLKADAIEVMLQDHLRRIPLPDIGEREIGITHVSNKRIMVLGTYQLLPLKGAINCYSPEGGKRTWRTDVWATINNASFSHLGPFHHAQVIPTDRMVYMIGIGSLGTYIEGFDIEQGDVRFRFVGTTILHDR